MTQNGEKKAPHKPPTDFVNEHFKFIGNEYFLVLLCPHHTLNGMPCCELLWKKKDTKGCMNHVFPVNKNKGWLHICIVTYLYSYIFVGTFINFYY
jgi:hypothetical protein